jgi:hypothetical protein
MKIKSLCTICLAAIAVVLIIGETSLWAESASLIASVPGLSGIAADHDGNIYALSASKNAIILLSKEGQVLGSIGPTLPNGDSLQIRQLFHPIHVDSMGRIYVPSRGRLLIMNKLGELLNVDSNGKLLPGFTEFISWIGTSRTGDIYLCPAIDDKNSLISVISQTGQLIATFGDIVTPRGYRQPLNFRFAMDKDDALYAVFAEFPRAMKYNPDRSFGSLLTLSVDERTYDPSKQSLEQTLKLIHDNKPLPENRKMIIQAVTSINDNLICLTTDKINWYSSSGELLRTIDLLQIMGMAGYNPILRTIVPGCGGQCLLGIGETNDNIYKISY